MAVIRVRSSTLGTQKITDHSFGGNYLFNRTSQGEGIGEGGRYDELAQKIGVSHLRYPGGGIAEKLFEIENSSTYDETNPESALGFLKCAKSIGAHVTIVLPTARYAQAIATNNLEAIVAIETEIKSFVAKVVQSKYGSLVEGFEIGNEFYAQHEFTEQANNNNSTAAKVYGKVASLFSEWIQDAIDSSGTGNDPAIIVQAGQNRNQNDDVMSMFSTKGLASIDGVTVHNYRPTPWQSIDVTKEKFSFMDDWQDRTGSRDLLRVVSEWNVPHAAGTSGLLMAAGLLDLFYAQEKMGVDRAQIWPLIQNTNNAMSNTTKKSLSPFALNLSINGEVFRQLSRSLDGLSPYNLDSRQDYNGDGVTDALLQAYGNGVDRLVIYLSSLSSRSESFAIDLTTFGEITTKYSHLWGQITGVTSGEDPLNSKSSPKVVTLGANSLEGSQVGDGKLQFALKPYEIIAIEFNIGHGVSLYGHDQTTQCDTLLGSAFDDQLFGGAGSDKLVAGIGNDYLDGGVGADRLSGEQGDDTYLVDNKKDIVVENSDGGCDTVESSISYALPADVENLNLLGERKINGAGNACDNRISGNAADNWLTGMYGSDSLFGGAGNDRLNGGAGEDCLDGGIGDDTYYLDSCGDRIFEELDEGVDTVVTSVYLQELPSNVENMILTKHAYFDAVGNYLSNKIFGNNYANNLFGLEGSDLLYGGRGGDCIFGGDDDDLLDGGAGTDSMTGGAGNDTYVVDATTDVIVEAAGGGTDLVQSAVTLTLGTEVENLTLTGTAAINGTGNAVANRLIGNSAINTLSGGGGGDTLDGGAGNDLLTGGAGADQFLFNASSAGTDTITDFNQLDGGADEFDVMEFQGLLVGSFAYLGTGAFTGGSDNSEARVSGNQVLVDTDGNGVANFTITLTGLTDANQIGADDFLFT